MTHTNKPHTHHTDPQERNNERKQREIRDKQNLGQDLSKSDRSKQEYTKKASSSKSQKR